MLSGCGMKFAKDESFYSTPTEFNKAGTLCEYESEKACAGNCDVFEYRDIFTACMATKGWKRTN